MIVVPGARPSPPPAPLPLWQERGVRLANPGVAAFDLYQQGSMRRCHFHNNNGLALEADAWLGGSLV